MRFVAPARRKQLVVVHPQGSTVTVDACAAALGDGSQCPGVIFNGSAGLNGCVVEIEAERVPLCAFHVRVARGEGLDA